MSGDEVEDVVAVLLLRNLQRGQHVRPSQGDGGIDVYVPDGPQAASVVAYQIKKFASNLTSGQKSQVEKSARRLKAWTEDSKQTVNRLYVTLPLDPTPENLTWIAELEQEVGFPVDWFGLSHIEGLVAEFPGVVDYYLHGGRAEVESATSKLTDLLRSTMQIKGSGADLSPDEVREHLGQLQDQVSRNDPFYEYEFMVTVEPPNLVERERVVFMATEGMAERNFVTITVLARFEDAPNFHPAEVEFKAMPADEAEEAAFRDFLEYGLPAQVTAEMTSTMPGGLGVDAAMGRISVGPTSKHSAKSRQLRWDMVTEQDEKVAGVTVLASEPTRGLRATGSAVIGSESTGSFTSTWRFNFEMQKLSIGVERHDVTGRPVLEVLNASEFLAVFGAPHRLRVSAPFGPLGDESQYLPTEPPASWVRFAELLRDLATIQEVTNEAVLVPALSEVTGAKRAAIRTAAKLASGELVEGLWGGKGEKFSLTLHSGREFDPTATYAIRWIKPLIVDLPAQQVDLGHIVTELSAATWSGEEQETPGGRKVYLVPIESDRRMRRWRGEIGGITPGEVFVCKLD